MTHDVIIIVNNIFKHFFHSCGVASRSPEPNLYVEGQQHDITCTLTMNPGNTESMKEAKE